MPADLINTCHCPKDGCVIPIVAEYGSLQDSRLRFSWCPWCQELYAWLDDARGGRDVGAFARPGDLGGWRLAESRGSKQDSELVVRAITAIGPEILQRLDKMNEAAQ